MYRKYFSLINRSYFYQSLVCLTGSGKRCGIPLFELPRNYHFRKRTLTKSRDPSAQMTCASSPFIIRTYQRDECIVIYDFNSVFTRTFCKFVKLSLANFSDVIFRERREERSTRPPSKDATRQARKECYRPAREDDDCGQDRPMRRNPRARGRRAPGRTLS